MVVRFLCGLLLLAISHNALAIDKLTASVDKNPVLVGEYFTLTIEADGKVSGESPDTRALAKRFSVGPIGTSSRTSIVNGSVSSSTTWQMQVMARRAGKIEIPSFTVAGATSDPITLNVVEREQDGNLQNDVFIKVELQQDPLYVQQAALYTVKLYVGKELLDGQLSAPELTDAQFTLIGKQKEEYEIVDGRRYYVVTREYLMQPNKSGLFTIDGPVFNGQVREGYRRMALSAVGENIDIDVKPIAENFPGSWLPSELVHLGEEWQPSETQVTVGTPITRTLTLTASGVTQEQLPEINLPQVNGIRAYPDDSERKQISRDGRIVSQLITSIALLPQQPGTYTLPEVKVPWFNTKMGRIEFAVLPAKTLTVVADPNAPIVPTVATPALDEQIDSAQSSQNISAANQNLESHYSWLDLGMMSFGYVLWLITLGWVWLTRNTKKTQAAASPSAPRMNDISALNHAVKAQDGSAYFRALNDYLQSYDLTLALWLERDTNDALKHAIGTLEASLYSDKATNADLPVLHALVVKALENTTYQKKKDKKRLSSLY
ncbi:BatD [Pseudoalteromonas luteoviolacea B = ATCC 29581]|nr:BatD [Pseudoalteromonas luteoviolacea B = ATCC 29581]